MKTTNISLALAAVMCTAVSCRDNGPAVRSQTITIKSDTIFVDAASTLLAHLKLMTVRCGPFTDELRTVGTAKAGTCR